MEDSARTKDCHSAEDSHITVLLLAEIVIQNAHVLAMALIPRLLRYFHKHDRLFWRPCREVILDPLPILALFKFLR